MQKCYLFDFLNAFENAFLAKLFQLSVITIIVWWDGSQYELSHQEHVFFIWVILTFSMREHDNYELSVRNHDIWETLFSLLLQLIIAEEHRLLAVD